MPSEIRAFQPVAGDPGRLVTVFETDPAAWLPEARQDDDNDDRWLLVLRAGALHRTVRMTVAPAWRAGATMWRSLSWEPVGTSGESTPTDRLLPSFTGELGIHAEGRERTTLALDGHYEPPGGRLGQAADTIALHRVAQATASSLVADIAGGLSTAAGKPPAPK